MSTVQIVLPSNDSSHIEFYSLDEYASTIVSTGGVTRRVLRLPTDPIGTHTLTLSNVADGSNILIISQDGSTIHYNNQYGSQAYTYQEAGMTYDEANILYNSQRNVAIVINVYAAGSALNDWRIRIRKATGSPYYQPYETLMTATVGSSSIYVSQIAD